MGDPQYKHGLDGHTKILTGNGILEIKDIQDGTPVWTGSCFAPCVMGGSGKSKCEKVWSRFGNRDWTGSLTASLGTMFLCLNSSTYELEARKFAEILSFQYALVRSGSDSGFTFDELLSDSLYRRQHVLELDEDPEKYKSLSSKYKDIRFDIVYKCDAFWYQHIDVMETETYILSVPKYNKFVANGFVCCI